MKYRGFWEVSEKELTKAINLMTDHLNIPPTVSKSYDLYRVIREEWKKSIAYQKYLNSLGNPESHQ